MLNQKRLDFLPSTNLYNQCAKDRDLYMAVVIIVIPNMIRSIPNQNYQKFCNISNPIRTRTSDVHTYNSNDFFHEIFMQKKSKSLLLSTQQSFFIMAFIINYSFPFIWSWKAKKRMGNEILFHFSFEMIQQLHFSLNLLSQFFQCRQNNVVKFCSCFKELSC